ncbi:hypothetical protein GC207_02790 [bacterium]|nr:hypothetical protein [bacterium]
MIVPRYWAEARRQQRTHKRQVTVRRFGWSNSSEAEAQQQAEQRAADALQKILAGENVRRFEPRVAYNGAEGVPIREEIVAEHGLTIITRNSYGALCLNSPDVLFADVDFERRPVYRSGCVLFIVLALISIAIAWNQKSGRLALGLIAASVFAAIMLPSLVQSLLIACRGGAQKIALKNIHQFVATHPDWKLRVYRTPAGYRVLVLHRPFSPDEPEVADFFRALDADPVYVKMCQRQKCFRARVSPKPWRIGVAHHVKPRPGLWPVRPEAMPARRKWISDYEDKARSFASCRLEEEFGNGTTHESVRPVLELHDELCRAQSGLTIA